MEAQVSIGHWRNGEQVGLSGTLGYVTGGWMTRNKVGKVGFSVMAKIWVLYFGSMDSKQQNNTIRFVFQKDYSGNIVEVALKIDQTRGRGTCQQAIMIFRQQTMKA